MNLGLDYSIDTNRLLDEQRARDEETKKLKGVANDMQSTVLNAMAQSPMGQPMPLQQGSAEAKGGW
jgi:hypothetical protein